MKNFFFALFLSVGFLFCHNALGQPQTVKESTFRVGQKFQDMNRIIGLSDLSKLATAVPTISTAATATPKPTVANIGSHFHYILHVFFECPIDGNRKYTGDDGLEHNCSDIVPDNFSKIDMDTIMFCSCTSTPEDRCQKIRNYVKSEVPKAIGSSPAHDCYTCYNRAINDSEIQCSVKQSIPQSGSCYGW